MEKLAQKRTLLTFSELPGKDNIGSPPSSGQSSKPVPGNPAFFPEKQKMK
jgi:hypothetical protein